MHWTAKTTLAFSSWLAIKYNISLSANALSWFLNYMSARIKCVHFAGSYSSFVPVHKGGPQGSIFGPLLITFVLIYWKLHFYADDTIIQTQPSVQTLVGLEWSAHYECTYILLLAVETVLDHCSLCAAANFRRHSLKDCELKLNCPHVCLYFKVKTIAKDEVDKQFKMLICWAISKTTVSFSELGLSVCVRWMGLNSYYKTHCLQRLY